VVFEGGQALLPVAAQNPSPWRQRRKGKKCHRCPPRSDGTGFWGVAHQGSEIRWQVFQTRMQQEPFGELVPQQWIIVAMGASPTEFIAVALVFSFLTTTLLPTGGGLWTHGSSPISEWWSLLLCPS
jgi:hypothetical protein